MSMVAIAFLAPLSPETQQMFDQINKTGKTQTVIPCESCGQQYILVHPETLGPRQIEVYRNHIRARSGSCHNGHVPFIRYPEGLSPTQS